MTRPEDLLHHALEHRAARTTWAPTPASSVVRRAGRARRRRRLAAVAGAAVLVVAVAVPVSLLGSSDAEVAPAIAVDSASAPPRIGYAVDDVYRVRGGGLVQLPDGTTSVTPGHHDGLLFATYATKPGDGLTVRELNFGPDLARRQPTLIQQPMVSRDPGPGPAPTTGRPVIDDSGVSAVASEPFPDSEYPLEVSVTGQTLAPGDWFVRGLPDDAILLGIDRDDSRTVFLQPDTGRVATIRPQQSPRTGTTVPGIDVVQDYTSATRLFSDVRPDASGGGVADDDGTRLWRLDGTLPGTFSPDGTRLLAVTGDDLEVRDARSGELQSSLTGAAEVGGRSELRDVVWEDDDHLLASRAVDGGRELVRVGLNGAFAPLTVPDLPGDADLVWDTRP